MSEIEVKAGDPPMDPMAAEAEKLKAAGITRFFNDKTNQWENRKLASIRLASATIMEQFRDDLYPDRPQVIEIGSRVYVKPLKVEGTVARIKEDGTLRIDANGLTQTFWPLEVEALPAK